METIECIELTRNKVELLKRDDYDLKRYPNHPYAVRLIRKTPKAKFFHEKTEWCYVYKSKEEASDKAVETALNITRNEEHRNSEKEKARKANAEVNASDFYKVGDVIVNTWGYEQTNVDFYQVTEMTAKTIKIKEIYSAMVSGSEYSHGMACNVVPVLNDFKENGREYALRVKDKGNLSNPASYYYMHKWDGRPEYKSWYA